MGASFIALIPKNAGADHIKDFRPISLIGSLYKIVAKVLANRLQKVLSSIISKPQSAFVKGRQILDGDRVIIADECVHSRHKDNVPGLLCKLDFEKAYDGVDWQFLMYLLKRMGFGQRWRKWIKECISSAMFSIMINGSPKGFFPVQRGLGQGDPLTPFLFVIVGEALSRMIGAAEKAGLIVGFKAAAKAPIISRLQFADDMLIFCGAEEDQVRSIKAVLLCFEAVSGLTINFYKSELIGMRVEERCLQHFAGILGCKTGSFPVS